jgi:putative copper export protein
MLDALAAIAQLATYAGILCAIGGVFAAATLRANGESARVLWTLARGGAVLTIAATLAAVIVLIYRLGGQFDDATISAVLMSSVGAAGGMRLAGAALLLMSAADTDDTFVRGMRLSYAAIIAASFVFAGHAAAAGFGAGVMACAHISIASWWIGSLVAMERACATQDIARVASLVQRFSAIAVGAIAALILAGIILIVVLVTLPVVEVTPYVVTLGLKIFLATLVFALAGYNKFRLTPRVLVADLTAVRALRTAIDVELVLIAAVLVATATLTTYNAPQE